MCYITAIQVFTPLCSAQKIVLDYQFDWIKFHRHCPLMCDMSLCVQAVFTMERSVKPQVYLIGPEQQSSVTKDN